LNATLGKRTGKSRKSFNSRAQTKKNGLEGGGGNHSTKNADIA